VGKVLKEVSRISGTFGQEGEEKVSKNLEENLPDEYLILNSPRIAYHNDIVEIDHVVIGPNGIFIIETKNMRGKISGGLMGNWVQEKITAGKREVVKIGNPASQVNQYTKIIRQHLKEKYQEIYGETKNFKLEPVVVFTHEQSNLSGMQYTHKGKIGKVRVCILKDLAEYVMTFEKSFYTPEEMQNIADLLIPPNQRDQTGIFENLAVEARRDNFLSRYQVIEEIGRGSFGAIYRGYDTKLDRPVAIKKLYPRRKTEDMMARFLREAKITARLKHENIVAFYDYHQENGEFYMVMELVPGRPLDEILQEGPLPLLDMEDIIQAVGSALQYAHDNRVIHRDLKASNILVTDDLHVKVTDFGIARMAGEEELTHTTTSIGTPTIMAPEQIMGKEVDYRVDIFALGVLLYQMTTGTLPFPGDNIGQVVNNILYSEPEPPSKYNPEVPTALDLVILKALAKNPEERYQEVDDLTQAISAALDPFNLDEEELKPNAGLIGLWRNEKKKFYTIAIISILGFFFLLGLQFYQDAKFAREHNLRPGGQNAIEQPGRETTIVTNDNLRMVLNNLNNYLGSGVQIEGRIIETVGHLNNSLVVRMAVFTKEGEPPVTVLVAFTGDPHSWFDRSSPNNEITVVGVMDKLTSQNPQTKTVSETPLVIAKNREELGPWSELDPTRLEVIVGNTIDRNGKQVTLSKIQFAQSETRLFVTVKNNTFKKAHFSLGQPVGIQGGREISQLYNIQGNYEFNLDPGKKSEGIIYLGPMNIFAQEAEFRLGNNLFGEEPYVFKVKWELQH